MAIRVPYLTEERIERDAMELLAEYEKARGVRIVAPIPIEDIVEKHLRLRIEFDDLHRLFDQPRPGNASEVEILGAMFFDERRVVIDENLDPEERPRIEGRYRFTVAHEGGGHWRLHRHLFIDDPSQRALFGQGGSPSVVCRTSQAKEPVEWQADFYASCLLMPRDRVMAAWDEQYSDRKPRVLQPLNPVDHPFVEVSRYVCRIAGLDWNMSVNEALEEVARPLAERFLVSPIAMRIRLEKLGLLYREVPHQRLLACRE
ncbi:MAG: ImmA/IrrE family metallo-endopeptidase [Myxococcota bacterium]